MSRIRIALLAGGWSGERAVSLNSGKAVFQALDKRKYEVTIYDPRDESRALLEAREEIDLAFVLLHGRFGEDGRIQGFLDVLGIPFVGSGVLSSALALNKKVAKTLFRGAGLKVAKDMVIRKGEEFSPGEMRRELGDVTVVKPVSEGSSLGMSLCRSEAELVAGIALAFQQNDEVLIEQYLKGREVTCCILGNEDLYPLPLIEIMPGRNYGFFDYEAKYTPGATEEVCPAALPEALSQEVRTCAKMAHRLLDCRVWSRTDMIISDGAVYLLETNTVPGMTSNSLFPLAAKVAGLSLSELADRMIDLALDQSPGI
jgi:D-alanine-D-alanine ligase